MEADSRIGARLAGYKIESVLGRGGMGVVYRAVHVHLGRTVALKLLAPELAQTEGFRERFIRESRIAAALDHPNVVPVYDAGETDGLLYIAMRYVEGTDLADLLAAGPLDSERALDVLGQVGAALDAAHASGLVHRDVKPANVMVEGERVYLTDFGLTKPIDAATAFTQSGQFLGTINYVAPEQIRGLELDGRADVYALGCVLHECLVGAPPFRRDSDVAVLYAHLEEPPPRPSDQSPGLPAAIDAVIERALAKAPADRFASCAALVDAARTALAAAPPQPTRAVPVVAPPSAPPASAPAAAPRAPAPAEPREATATTHALQRPPVRARRRPAMIAAAGLAALAALAVAVVLVAGGSDEQPRRSAPPRGGDDLGGAAEERARSGARTKVGDAPVGVAARDGRVWVANSGDGTVSLLDARTRRVVRRPMRVGGAPYGLTVGRGVVWVANSRDGTVSRLSAASGDPLGEPTRVGSDPRWVALAVGGRWLWVTNSGDGTVTRIDAASGRVAGRPIPVGDDPRGIATTPTRVWVANAGDGTLTRLDAQSGEVVGDPVPAGAGAEGIAIKDGVTWVANSGDGTVTRHSNSTGRMLGPPIEVGGEPFAVWVGERHVYVSNAADGTLTRIDPVRGELVGEPIHVGGTPSGVRADDGAIWIADRQAGEVVKLSE